MESTWAHLIITNKVELLEFLKIIYWRVEMVWVSRQSLGLLQQKWSMKIRPREHPRMPYHARTDTLVYIFFPSFLCNSTDK
jgi:hypothetical protein